MEKEIINIPLEVPIALVEAGAIELYATKFAGWTPTIKQVVEDHVRDEEGNILIPGTKEIDVPNPETAYEACVRQIRAYVKENYKAILAEEAARKSREQAEEQFEQLFQ